MQTKPTTAVSEKTLVRMIELYEGGATLAQLSMKYKVEIHAVRRELVNAGVQIRKKGRQVQGHSLAANGMPRSRNSEIVALYCDESLSPRPTLQEIGARFGLTRERVRQILKEMGVESQGRRPMATGLDQLDERERKIAESYEAGMRPADLRKKYRGLTYASLQAILKKGGVEIKPKGFFNRRSDYETIAKGVVADYVKGEDTDVIADRYGLCGRTEIYKFLKRAGVQVRERHPAK